MLGILHADDSLEDGALALLNPLAHRVEVGGEVNAGGIDTQVVLALALAIELLPPLCHEVQFGLVVGQNLYLLASLVERIASGCILG